jgi:hypothetical protein
MPTIIIPRNGRPRWPFRPHHGSSQAQGLVAWWPLWTAINADGMDFIGARTMGRTNSPAWAMNQHLGHWLAPTFDGSTQHMSTSSAPVSATPLSLACWIIADSFAVTNRRAIGVYNSAGTSGWQLEFSTGGFPLARTTTEASSTGSASAAGTKACVVGNLHHVIAVFASNTARMTFTDGGHASAIQTTSRAPSSLTTAALGVQLNATPANWFDGWILDARIYNRALDAEDAAHLFHHNTRWELYRTLKHTAVHIPDAGGGAARPRLVGGRLVNRSLTLGGLVQ